MTVPRRMTMRLLCLTVLALAGGLDAYGQTLPTEPWWNALLVRARREDDAIDLVERIAQARPALLGSAFEELHDLATPYLPWDPKAEGMTARLKTLREQVERAPKSSVTEPVGYNNLVAANQARDGESERALLNVQRELERTHESLSEWRKWSVRDVGRAVTPVLKPLRDMAERDRGPYGQQALALLADSEFEAGQLREASGHFTLLEQRYQDSEVAWAAGLRAAQLTQSLGDPEAATESFARVAAVYAGKPTVPALASFYEARAYEAMSRWPDALRAYRTAFNAWPANDNDWIGLEWKVRYFVDPFVDSLWPQYISRSDVAQRIKVLTQVVAVPADGEIERATWLLDHHRPSEARGVLLRVAKTHQGTMPTPSLRSLLHRAEVDKAVFAISRQGQLSRQAVRALERVCGEPFDAWVGIGCAIHASVLAVDGQAEAAEVELRRAFRSWVDAQSGATKPSIPENDIARDAMIIRDLLFEPDGVNGLRGQSASYTPPPFIFMPSALRVTTSESSQSQDAEARTPQGRSNVILLSIVEARSLWETVARLSACDQRRSEQLDRLWVTMLGFSKPYCAIGGSSYTAPTVDHVNFMNFERTRAHVTVGDGNGGWVAVVERVDGNWKVTGIAGSWVNQTPALYWQFTRRSGVGTPDAASGTVHSGRTRDIGFERQRRKRGPGSRSVRRASGLPPSTATPARRRRRARRCSC